MFFLIKIKVYGQILQGGIFIYFIFLVDGISNGYKMFKEFVGYVFIDIVLSGQGQGDFQYDGVEKGYLRSGIRLYQVFIYVIYKGLGQKIYFYVQVF